jgi:hypothetical protein
VIPRGTFALVRPGAACRNRTDDLFITSVSEHRAGPFPTVHLPRQIPISAPPGTALHLQELSRKLSRKLQLRSLFLQPGPPHARERIRRP